MREKVVIGLALLSGILLAYNLHHMFLVLPDEAMQGAIYRIIFFHVPAAFTGLLGCFVALVLNLLYLSSGNLRYDSYAASVTEVSLVFALVNIVTGSIWARIIWGIWWTWDYRLTSALVLVLIYCAYLLLRRAIDEPTQRARLSASLSIFGSVDAVLVWKSIEWFRTQHPGPVLDIRTGGGHIDPDMQRTLYLNFLALLLLAIALVLVRMRQESTSREIDSLRRIANAY